MTNGGAQRLVAYEYDAAGRLSRESRGNGTSATYEYDAASQLLHLVHRAPDVTILSRFDYTYDDNGRRTSMTTLEGKTDYGYDAASRLIFVALPGGRIITYAYDAAGNRTVTSDNGATTAYTTNDMNQYLAVGGTNQSFDADGNLVSSSGPGGVRSYTYDAEGRLTSLVTAQGMWTYEYDALGNRLASTHDGVRTQYLIDPAGLSDVFGEFDAAGTSRAHYAHGLGLVGRIDVSGPAAYYQFDAVGNTAQLTGAGGAVLNSYSYLPFGEPLQVNETVPNPFTYVGQFGVMREGNGLDYMRNRWYDPAEGRFTQQDPIGLAGGTNLYQYALNDPLTFVDPQGWVPSQYFGPGGRGSIPSSGTGGVYNFNPPSPAGRYGEAFARQNWNELQAKWAETAAERVEQQAARSLTRAGIRIVGRVLGYAALAVADAAAIVTLAGIQYGTTSFILTSDFPPCQLSGGWQIFELCKGPEWPFGRSAGKSSTEQIDPSKDPNDISGPAGFGDNHFVPEYATLPYTILFENIPNAVGPAAQVVVTHRLDDDLDLDTFQLGDFGFGDLVVDVPEGRQIYSTRLDLLSTRNVLVDVTAELNRQTRVVMWTLTALDPTTLDIPIDPFTGFLPPDKVQPEGQGFVNYTIRPKADSATGTRIESQATIVFDTNDPIDTPLWFNTIDDAPPMSNVLSLPPLENATFTVKWSGADEAGGSGSSAYDVYVSDNGGPYTLWQSGTTLIAAQFTGQPGHTYRFYSVATDNVGHVEFTATTPDAVTQISSHIWHNVLNSLDVASPTGQTDGLVVPGDALEIINYINAFGAGKVPTDAVPGPPYLDTSGGPGGFDGLGDDFVVAADVLAVINFINAFGAGLPGPSGEGETAAANPSKAIVDAGVNDSSSLPASNVPGASSLAAPLVDAVYNQDVSAGASQTPVSLLPRILARSNSRPKPQDRSPRADTTPTFRGRLRKVSTDSLDEFFIGLATKPGSRSRTTTGRFQVRLHV